MLRRFPSRVSLQWKLPAVICGLILLVVIALSASAFFAVRRAVELAANERLRSVTAQLASLLETSARQNRARVRTTARNDTVRTYLQDPAVHGRATTLAALRYAGPNPDQVLAVELWNTAGRRLLADGVGATRTTGLSPATL